MEINIYTIGFTILNFIILYIFLRKMLFQKVQNFVGSRTRAIEEQIDNAQKNMEEAGNLKTEWQKKLSDVRAEGKNIVEEYKERANYLSDEILGKARKEAENIMERARIESEREKEKARAEVREQIINLSILAASRAIGGQLDENKQHEMIKEFIDKVGV